MSKTTYENVKVVMGTPAIADAGAGSDVNGTGFDRTGFHSCILTANVGALTGGGALSAATARLQESDSLSSGYADITGASLTLAEGSVIKKSVNLRGCKKYIRVVTKLTMSTGTCPLSTDVILGEADVEPISY